MKFSIFTSYFYQIRNFTSNLIPVSVCLRDPVWYRPPQGKEYYIDKRGVVNGLRYEPLIVQRYGVYTCPCEHKDQTPFCPTMIEYENLLKSLVDKEKTLKAFEFCCNKFKKELNLKKEPIICLMIYEAPTNPCSERIALQHFFNCRELEIDRKEK
jgi:hypothetical protein